MNHTKWIFKALVCHFLSDYISAVFEVNLFYLFEVH